MVKVGNLQVYSCCKGRYRPTLGPYWYLASIPQCVCMAMLSAIIFGFSMSIPDHGPWKTTAWVLIGIEAIVYWVPICSNPGMPDKILRRAEQIAAGDGSADAEFSDVIINGEK